MSTPISIGTKISYLTIISKNNNESDNWTCHCDCGNEIVIRGFDLRNKRKKSCGCKANKPKDLTGQKFGRLTVVNLIGGYPKRWLCICDCGTERDVQQSNLISGDSTSCGCYNRERIQQRMKKNIEPGTRFGNFIVVREIAHVEHTYEYECRCDCGKIFNLPTYRLLQQTYCSLTCPLRSDDIIGKKYGMLTALRFSHTQKNNDFWLFRCECGNERALPKSGVKTGQCTHCGCKTNEHISVGQYKLIPQNTRYGGVKVILPLKTLGKGCLHYIVRCGCKRYFIARGDRLKHREVLSCGCWTGHVNGFPTSIPQRKIAKFFPGSKLNHPFENTRYPFGIDVALVDQKIAIEFDCWYWHRKIKNSEITEQRKNKLLQEYGWKILRIRSGNEVPSKEKLEITVQLLQNGMKYIELVTNDWRKNTD